jgi:hypothetical protein
MCPKTAPPTDPSTQAVHDVRASDEDGDSEAMSTVRSHREDGAAHSIEHDELAVRILARQEELATPKSPLQAALCEAFDAVYTADARDSTTPARDSAAANAHGDARAPSATAGPKAQDEAVLARTLAALRADGARAVAALRAEVESTQAEAVAALERARAERARAEALLRREALLADERGSALEARTLARNDREVQLIAVALGAEARADERVGALEAQVLSYQRREIERVGGSAALPGGNARESCAPPPPPITNAGVRAGGGAALQISALRAALAAADAESASLATECAVLAEERNAARCAAEGDAAERARLEDAHAALLVKHARLAQRLDDARSAPSRTPPAERDTSRVKATTPRAQMNREYDDMTAHYSASVWLESAPPRRARAKRGGARARRGGTAPKSGAEIAAGVVEAVRNVETPLLRAEARDGVLAAMAPAAAPGAADAPLSRGAQSAAPSPAPPSPAPLARARVALSAFEDGLMRDIARSMQQPAALAGVLQRSAAPVPRRVAAPAAAASAARASPGVQLQRPLRPGAGSVEAAAQRNLLAVEFKLLLRAGRSRHAAVTMRSSELLAKRSGLGCVSVAAAVSRSASCGAPARRASPAFDQTARRLRRTASARALTPPPPPSPAARIPLRPRTSRPLDHRAESPFEARQRRRSRCVSSAASSSSRSRALRCAAPPSPICRALLPTCGGRLRRSARVSTIAPPAS